MSCLPFMSCTLEVSSLNLDCSLVAAVLQVVQYGSVSLFVNLCKGVKNEHLFRLGNVLFVRQFLCLSSCVMCVCVCVCVCVETESCMTRNFTQYFASCVIALLKWKRQMGESFSTHWRNLETRSNSIGWRTWREDISLKMVRRWEDDVKMDSTETGSLGGKWIYLTYNKLGSREHIHEL